MTTFDSPSIRIGGQGVRFGNPAFVMGDKAAAFGTGGGLTDAPAGEAYVVGADQGNTLITIVLNGELYLLTKKVA